MLFQLLGFFSLFNCLAASGKSDGKVETFDEKITKILSRTQVKYRHYKNIIEVNGDVLKEAILKLKYRANQINSSKK
jgi:hypothetical protein